MKHIKKLSLLLSLIIVFCASISLHADSIRVRVLPVKPEKAEITPGYDNRHISVKFADDIDIGLSTAGYPYDRSDQFLKSSKADNAIKSITDSGGNWRRMSVVEEDKIDLLVSNAERNLKREIADLNNYFILNVPEGVNAIEWIDKLNSLAEVEIALAMPLPMPAPMIPGNYQSSQGYLNSATDGIGASWAWTQPGGTGWPSYVGPVKICDFEYSWNTNHNDLPSVTTWIPPGYSDTDPYTDDNHGTAVLGVMHSLNNGWGTTGAVYQAQAYVAPTYLKHFSASIYTWQLGTAMTNMLSVLNAGDIMLIEQQMAGPNYTGIPPGTQDGLIPVEWWQPWYNIILTAIGNGINVVEAAGNGQEDLDDPIYGVANGGHWPFLAMNNSGAIIVGAGAAPASFGGSDTDRSRLWFSNYGSRLDLQGWGERVMTIGYGSYYWVDGVNYYYTNTFDGTSSASPTVASAVAILESMSREINTGGHISPANMRSTLISTGSPQQAGTYPIAQHIGPRPDVQAAAGVLFPAYICGDANGDLTINVSDAVWIINYVFVGGAPPNPLASGDANCDTIVNVSDAVWIINYVFVGGFAPCDTNGDTVPDC
jgi:Subtilase family/Dockerin type I domain